MIYYFNKNKIILILFMSLFLLFQTNLIGMSKVNDPIPVKLEIDNYKEIINYNNKNKFYIKSINDKRGYFDKKNIGFTFKGGFNLVTPFIIDIELNKKINELVTKVFSVKNIITKDQSSANFYLRIDITSFQFTEIHDMKTAHLFLDMEYNVIVFDPDNKVINRFNISESEKKSSWVTSKFADEIAQKVLIKSINSIITKLNSI